MSLDGIYEPLIQWTDGEDKDGNFYSEGVLLFDTESIEKSKVRFIIKAVMPEGGEVFPINDMEYHLMVAFADEELPAQSICYRGGNNDEWAKQDAKPIAEGWVIRAYKLWDKEV